MLRTPPSTRIQITGGYLSVSHLRTLAFAADRFADGFLYVGARQSMILRQVDPARMGDLAHIIQPLRPLAPRHLNLLSSLPLHGQRPGRPWLTPSAYAQILSAIVPPDRFSVNIIDPLLLPQFIYSGHINLIAAATPERWHLAVRDPDADLPTLMPFQIRSQAIPRLITLLKAAPHGVIGDPGSLAQLMGARAEKPTDTPPRPSDWLPDDYLGFLPSATSKDDRLYLGIDAGRGLPHLFVDELCALCLQNNIRSVGLTPWSSLAVHGIPAEAEGNFRNLLRKHHVPLGTGEYARHWVVSDATTASSELRQDLQTDLQTHALNLDGLSICVGREPAGIRAHIHIENNGGRRPFLIYHRQDGRMTTRAESENATPMRRDGIIPHLSELLRSWAEQATSFAALPLADTPVLNPDLDAAETA